MPEVDPKRKKNLQELIDRMGKGFDENLLDPLVDSIVNEPDKPLPSESQVKAKKIKYQVIEVSPTGKGEDLASFFGAKIGESFSMAAKARRADKGLAKPPMFYMGKALGNQFGGDLVNRTKGYVSANPDDTQDPALSRSQRFTASVQPFMGEQGPLPAPVQGPERTGIRGAFDKVAEQFDQLIALRKQKAEQSKVANQIQQIEVKEATEEITENNELKKKSTEIQKDFIAFNREQQGDAEILEVETTAEERDPMADTLDIDNRRDEDEEEGEDDDRDGGNKFTDFLDFGLDLLDGGEYFGRRSASVGRRGMGRVVQRTALRLGGKKLAKSAVVQGSQALLKKVALPLLRPIFKRIPLVGGLIDFVVSLALGEPIGRAAAKAIGATLGGALGTLIPIPGVGTIAGGILGDIVGGAIYDAATGGAPKDPTNSSEEVKEAAGAPSSFADQSGGLGSPDPPPEKLASGGIMAGEAGPEAVFSLSSTEGRKVVDEVSSVQNTSMSALPFILGITQNVTSLISGPAKPYIQQEIGTLERLFGIAKFNVSEVVGSGIDAVKSIGQKIGINIPGSSGGAQGVDAQSTMTGNNAGGPAPGINMGGGEGKTSAGAVYKYLLSKGVSEVHAKGITVNIMRESGFKLGAHNPNDPGAGSFGLFQWNAGRAEKMMAAVPNWASNMQGQIDYALGEDHGPRYLSTQFTSAGDAAYDWMKYWERPAESVQAKYTPQVYQSQINAMGLSADMPDTPASPPAAPAATPADADANGGHDPANPGPLGATPPPAPANPDQSTMAPPGPVATALAPMPMHLQESDKKSHITVQPIIYEGSSTPIGYQKNIDTGGGQMARFFYDKTGEKTTLVDLKAARLQTN
ncbi:hypothetical protein Np050604_011 [Cyanophage S-RIM44]|uniref:Phage tail lysozyme domain-containing protein n=1 Tax=Cyanophage S-RIM44 TaxID=1278485 RepID=A0A1D7SFQ4_9CAUD|nr:hypothetical protein Np050604_011 [Cyanophage S-RIM44]AOO12429.1 hypothetical protein Sn080709_011 [Cyanophage S-RIM44]AOO12894.1 hypothetical protein W2100709_011 [Cyanophage S-RIM44]